MYTLPQLPYAYNALEPYIDEETMRIHHDKHHAAYVTNLNEALKDNPEFSSLSSEELMKKLTQIPEAIRTKVRNNGGGHINHTFFWEMMAPARGQKPSPELEKAITVSFGGLTKLQEAWTKIALGRFGSGWVWLVAEKGTLKISDTPNQDNPWMEGKSPILGLDVWEHAYYLKYQNRRVEYVGAWWNVVNWDKVAELYKKSV
jgi:Fe-Mn family superoxide dismutase